MCRPSGNSATPEHEGDEPQLRWPGVACRRIALGGTRVTCAEAACALAALASVGSTAIRQVLKARGNPLAFCDYWAVITAYEGRHPGTVRGHGTKQAHVASAKELFALAVREELEIALRAEQACALAALRTDERYAAAIARDAVAVRQRAHAAAARTRVRGAVTAAVARCEAERTAPCALKGACGTGQCPFAPEHLRDAQVPAGPGKLARPRCHAGESFSDAAAAAWLAEAEPWRACVEVEDTEAARALDDVAA